MLLPLLFHAHVGVVSLSNQWIDMLVLKCSLMGIIIENRLIQSNISVSGINETQSLGIRQRLIVVIG